MMFVHAPQRAKSLTARIHTMTSVIYQGLVKPLPEDEAVWMEVSSTIQKLKHRSSNERRLLHQYAAAQLHDRLVLPADKQQVLLAIKAREIVNAQHFHYHKVHPWRRHHRIAA